MTDIMVLKPQIAQLFGSTPAPARQREDYLDWLQNQSRSPEDSARLDMGFFGWVLGGATLVAGVALVAIGTVRM